MVFTLGLKTLPGIIDEMAGSLIASVDPTDSLSHWSDADTTWNTLDKTGIKARRALKYTKDTEVMYVALESRNDWYSPWPGYTAKGLRVTFSATWDSVGHIYSSSNQQTSIPFDNWTGGAQPLDDFATLLIYYYLWVESNGFVIMAKPEPTNANNQNNFFLVVERNPNKEYSDGYSNFYCFSQMNIWPTATHTSIAYGDNHRSFLRPFVYQWPNVTSMERPFYYCMTSGNLERYNTILSPGDKKVYYMKSIISNNKIEPGQANTAMAPIFTAELWFQWNEGIGMIDGDIIQMEGTTKKFLLKSMNSPDSTGRLIYAMKYSD